MTTPYCRQQSRLRQKMCLLATLGLVGIILLSLAYIWVAAPV